jgi:hypothetical protein
MRVSDLTKETKKLEVVYRTASGDFPVKLEYRTQAVTMGFLKELEQAQGADRLVYQVTQVVTRWDLQDDNDQIIPITAAGIEAAGVPVYLLNSILGAIAEDRLLGAEAKNA